MKLIQRFDQSPVINLLDDFEIKPKLRFEGNTLKKVWKLRMRGRFNQKVWYKKTRRFLSEVMMLQQNEIPPNSYNSPNFPSSYPTLVLYIYLLPFAHASITIIISIHYGEFTHQSCSKGCCCCCSSSSVCLFDWWNWMVILMGVWFWIFVKLVKASSQSAVPWSSTNRGVVRYNIPAQQGFRSHSWVGFYKGWCYWKFKSTFVHSINQFINIEKINMDYLKQVLEDLK